ncbi:heterokaryon incompatibility protein-domain-containing protein, partial [Bisporella sp. PMI_857]
MFQYDELASSPLSFRLLTLKAASYSTDPINCILTSHARHSSPKYTTLSYTWGCPTPSKSITINSKTIPIRPSLESALRHLRLPHDDLIIWVDALCINQSSDAEKSAQVQCMQDIYAESEQTLVWLGEGSSVPVGELEKLGKEGRDPGKLMGGYRTIYTAPYWTRVWIQQEIATARH